LRQRLHAHSHGRYRLASQTTVHDIPLHRIIHWKLITKYMYLLFFIGNAEPRLEALRQAKKNLSPLLRRGRLLE